jgi:putative phosphoesterase
LKIVIISDIHGNLAALNALPERDFDELWCIGDLVDYGPSPHEVVEWVRQQAAVVVRGNHDHAAGFSVDPQCSAPFKKLAEDTLRFTQSVCTQDDFGYLRSLPVRQELTVNSTRFYLVHAMPSDPLFGYCPEDSDRWKQEVMGINADVLIVGSYAHTLCTAGEGSTTILNPGSLGQPKTGRPLSCYAVWQDREISLKEFEYPVAETIRGIRGMPIPSDEQDALIGLLETGSLPTLRSAKSTG